MCTFINISQFFCKAITKDSRSWGSRVASGFNSRPGQRPSIIFQSLSTGQGLLLTKWKSAKPKGNVSLNISESQSQSFNLNISLLLLPLSLPTPLFFRLFRIFPHSSVTLLSTPKLYCTYTLILTCAWKHPFLSLFFKKYFGTWSSGIIIYL